MRRFGDSVAFAKAPYRGVAGVRLSRSWTPVALVLALACGGCSYKLGAAFGTSETTISNDADVTGSIRNARAEQIDTVPEADLAYARAAAVAVMARGRNDVSQSWENPQSGARGTVTPLATTSNEGSASCRDFLASYVKGPSEAWWQGEACRQSAGQWEVRSMKPWKRG